MSTMSTYLEDKVYRLEQAIAKLSQKENPKLHVEILEHGKGLGLPSYAYPSDSGLDVKAAIDKPVTLMPLERKLIPLGFKMELPKGFEGQLRPRSGNALKKGITILNSPGTLDNQWRGENMAIVVNLSNELVTITRGDKIAQLVIAPVTNVEIVEVDKVSNDTERNEKGFGSSGQ